VECCAGFPLPDSVCTKINWSCLAAVTLPTELQLAAARVLVMDDADLFDEFVSLADLGHRFNRSQFPREIADEYDRYIHRIRSFIGSALTCLPRLSSVYADFVLNPSFNAGALKYKDRYFVVLFAGLPVIVTAVIFRMLADRRIFPQVGDLNEEASNLPLFTTITPDARELFKSGAVVACGCWRETPRSATRSGPRRPGLCTAGSGAGCRG
jgi:hypothetical protein